MTIGTLVAAYLVNYMLVPKSISRNCAMLGFRVLLDIHKRNGIFVS